MSKIAGNAKKYNGAKVDYIMLFDWATGDEITVIPPNEDGSWEYEYFAEMKIGITYVADGCKPISHGAYFFEADISGAFTSGFLLLSYASSGGEYVESYDNGDHGHHNDLVQNYSIYQ